MQKRIALICLLALVDLPGLASAPFQMEALASPSLTAHSSVLQECPHVSALLALFNRAGEAGEKPLDDLLQGLLSSSSLLIFAQVKQERLFYDTFESIEEVVLDMVDDPSEAKRRVHGLLHALQQAAATPSPKATSSPQGQVYTNGVNRRTTSVPVSAKGLFGVDELVSIKGDPAVYSVMDFRINAFQGKIEAKLKPHNRPGPLHMADIASLVKTTEENAQIAAQKKSPVFTVPLREEPKNKKTPARRDPVKKQKKHRPALDPDLLKPAVIPEDRIAALRNAAPSQDPHRFKTYLNALLRGAGFSLSSSRPTVIMRILQGRWLHPTRRDAQDIETLYSYLTRSA